MPVGESENRIFLSISYGKLRKKSTADDSKAVERENRQGDMVWERVFTFVEGQITNIYYKESEDYGNSFDVTIDDGENKWGISFKESSRYCQDFLSRLPNIDLSKWVRISPYDFFPKGSEKSRQGITVWQDETKIPNYFVAKVDDKFIYNHGFPESTGKMEKDDFKIYLIQVKKFLREYTNDNIISKIQKDFLETANEAVTEGDGKDDLPF